MGNGKAFFISVPLLMISCHGPGPQRQISDSLSVRDSIGRELLKTDTGTPIDKKTVPEIVKAPESQDSSSNCDTLLHNLVQMSDLGRGIRKYTYNLWVDSAGGGIAILGVHLGGGDKEYPVVGWLKLDYNTRQLWDITPDTPILLTCDTVVFQKMIAHCPIK